MLGGYPSYKAKYVTDHLRAHDSSDYQKLQEPLRELTRPTELADDLEASDEKDGASGQQPGSSVIVVDGRDDVQLFSGVNILDEHTNVI
jgi:hypothetical protein